MKVRKVPHFFCCFIWKCQKNVLSLWCKNNEDDIIYLIKSNLQRNHYWIENKIDTFIDGYYFKLICYIYSI